MNLVRLQKFLTSCKFSFHLLCFRIRSLEILIDILIHVFCLAGDDLEFQDFTHFLVCVLVCLDLLYIIGCCLEKLVYFVWLSLLYSMY